ncbi:hypothetical protein ONE63_010228 [Megalurothrips usitatus]|uniref:Uncharacterized protein n=1 Tax=Megalurothrips usitatus TaxID=439358 RepID=A0AAV7XLW7_9NEOP|nr:hypothetical protein ONE63_010228 [Megalurothrips usitatus]
MLLVRRLHWPSLLLAHGEDAASRDVAAALLRLVDEDPDVCVQSRVLSVSEDGRGDSDVAWAISKDKSGGVVVIVESTERGAALLSRLSALPHSGPGGEVHVLLSVRQAEAGAAAVPAASAPARVLSRLKGVAITLMHEVSPPALVPGTQRALLSDSPLWQGLSTDHHGEPDVMEESGLQGDSQDASVGALTVGVSLMGAGLRAAHRIKCPGTVNGVVPPAAPGPGEPPGPAPTPPSIFCPALHAMAPDEWRSILERVTAFAEAATTGGRAAAAAAAVPAKLRFGMELRSAARVLVKRSDTEYFEKAGMLVGGRDLQLESSRFAFPAVRPGVDNNVCGGAAAAGTTGQGAGSTSGSTAATSAPPQRPPKSNRALDRHPRTTPSPKAGSGRDMDWSWILGGSSEGGWGGAGDGDFWQMVYVLVGAAAVMLFIFLLCFYIVYRNFRVKSDQRRDKDSPNSSPRTRRSARRDSDDS